MVHFILKCENLLTFLSSYDLHTFLTFFDQIAGNTAISNANLRSMTLIKINR